MGEHSIQGGVTTDQTLYMLKIRKQEPAVVLFQLHIDAKLNTSLIFRYEVLYHESCAVGCPTGLPESGTSVGLSRRHVVRDLSPYTMYNVRIRVYNARQSSLSDEQAVRTRASGMWAGVYYHFQSRKTFLH